MLKPDSCIGCPLYADGSGFVPDQLVEGSDTMIVMQNPGATEEELAVPAIGETGKLMDGTFIPLAGLYRERSAVHGVTDVCYHSNVSVGNVLKCRVVGADGKKCNDLPVGQVLVDAVNHCTDAHLRIPESVQFVVAQGALSYQYFSGGDLHEGDGKPSTLKDWRGHRLPDTHDYETRPVFIVGHLADHYRDPKQRWISEQDWKRIKDLRDGLYPLGVPARPIIRSTDDWAVAYGWFEEATRSGKAIICDTEFYPDNKYLTVVGLCYRDNLGTVQGIQFDLRDADKALWEQVAWKYGELVKTNSLVFHNAIADIMVLDQNFGVKYEAYHRVEDTMLAHSSLWGELPHTLDFCASVYSPFPRLKHLASDDLTYYNWGDCIATLAVYEALNEDLKYDSGARNVYSQQLLKLIPILAGAKARGIRINAGEVLAVQPKLYSGMDAAERIARVGTGRWFNLGSDDQLKDWLYRTQEYPVQKNKDTKRATTDDDAIGVLREYVGPAFDSKVDITPELAIDRILSGADSVLEARVLYVANEHILNNYIFPLHVKAPHGDKSKAKFNRQLRKSGLWRADDVCERIFPDIATHIQKSGRHSTSNPPLAQLPAEYRDIIRPGRGCLWIKWDWSAIEPRLLEALCGSSILKRSFDEGIDLHTWTVCEIFGYPQPPDLVNPHKCKCLEDCEHERWRKLVSWKGKDDPRRVFAKTGRYEVWYGGTGSNAASAAARFGLDRRLLKSAVQRLASSDSDYYRWRCEIEAETKRTRLVRSWGGRPRRLLGQGSGVIREALNHPMQAGVSDIYNLTIIELYETYKQLSYVFGMHDSQWWSVRADQFTPELYQGIRGVVEKVRSINGVLRPFPADFEITDEWSNHYGSGSQFTIDDYFNGKRYQSAN